MGDDQRLVRRGGLLDARSGQLPDRHPRRGPAGRGTGRLCGQLPQFDGTARRRVLLPFPGVLQDAGEVLVDQTLHRRPLQRHENPGEDASVGDPQYLTAPGGGLDEIAGHLPDADGLHG
ncbi:hypothetical protein GCM10010365_54980 [Streptomyces poonensis]|uniref:Uncharacterized protein n=1 Tax=Streptomyces poonensis TaxID=68255 RepID=A0A918PZ00_9ACTN|nr:hypothetical protein GCM10010365_54980 [Streptomyces poonensis]GLJ89728.1 hypothetical protein GCM10017589_23290 [Streptomyces poonensis]